MMNMAAHDAAFSLLADRQCDFRSRKRADRAEWGRLAALQPEDPLLFSDEMVSALPEPAQRYFAWTIKPGARLYPVVEIDMRGQFSLGSKEDPGYQPMTASQILAAPEGLLWSMRTHGGLPISGSDSGSWTRFRVFWLIPVARFGGTPDHTRSAFGRYVAEAAFWSPAALLPGPGVRWEALDENTARITVSRGALSQAVDVTVDAAGRPVQVAFQRWSDANPKRVYHLQSKTEIDTPAIQPRAAKGSEARPAARRRS